MMRHGLSVAPGRLRIRLDAFAFWSPAAMQIGSTIACVVARMLVVAPKLACLPSCQLEQSGGGSWQGSGVFRECPLLS